MSTKLSPQEQDVQIIMETLNRYPMWANETEILARGLVSDGVGSLDRVREEYEMKIEKLEEEISEKKDRITELSAINAELVRVLTAIRELTCSRIGIKIDETEAKGVAKEAKK